ncbi:hypothetical protein BS78_05G115000 [Paspalum vaginatum]|nr:hypothetical protein BS78_05G115000 [Paspalum vaginatum]
MRQTGKVMVLLLLVCAIISPHPVLGGKKRPRCTGHDKANILHHCEAYIKNEHHHGTHQSPAQDSSCCDAVRAVPGNDMQCIVDLLTEKERHDHKEGTILGLGEACESPAHPPPHP